VRGELHARADAALAIHREYDVAHCIGNIIDSWRVALGTRREAPDAVQSYEPAETA